MVHGHLTTNVYERMVSSILTNFYDLVVVGVKVELSVKNGKMMVVTGTSNNNNVKKFFGGFQKKKERETNVVSVDQGRNRSWRKQQRQFSRQQPTYPMKYVQQLYVAEVTPAFGQP